MHESKEYYVLLCPLILTVYNAITMLLFKRWAQFFSVTSVYLSLLIAVHIFLLITQSKTHHLKDETLLKLLGGLVFLSLLGSIVPLINDYYGLLGKSYIQHQLYMK